MERIQLIINGSPRELNAVRNLAEVIEQLGLAGKPVVAEVEGEVVTSEDWSGTAISPGMSIELVHFVGGG
jgi:sulfur carrier protein